MPDREKVITEIEDALSGNLAKAGHIYRMSLNGLKDKALKDAIDLLKKQREIVLCKDCKYGEKCREPHIDYWCNVHEFYRDGNWFCADGQPR